MKQCLNCEALQRQVDALKNLLESKWILINDGFIDDDVTPQTPEVFNDIDEYMAKEFPGVNEAFKKGLDDLEKAFPATMGVKPIDLEEDDYKYRLGEDYDYLKPDPEMEGKVEGNILLNLEWRTKEGK